MEKKIIVECAECGCVCESRDDACDHLLAFDNEQREEFPVDTNVWIN